MCILTIVIENVFQSHEHSSGLYNNNNNNIISHSKAQFEMFYNLLTAQPTVSNTYAQVARRNGVQITCNTSGAYHVQHVVLRATWYEGTVHLLSLTELKSHFFQLDFIG